MSAELVVLSGIVGGIYGAITTGIGYSRSQHEPPPFRLLARSALSEGTEWAGAGFMTELLMSNRFPEDLRTLGSMLTVALWLEAIFPKMIGER